MTRSRFSEYAQQASSPQKPNPKAPHPKSDNLTIQLLILGLVITLLAVLVVQNLQPLVEIFFLGQKTLPIPLSVAMLVAFVMGGLIAYTINMIANWRQDSIIRRAVIAANENRDQPQNVASSASQPVDHPKDFGNRDGITDANQKFVAEDEYEDEEYEDYEDEYEEDEYEQVDEVVDQQVLDDDPDTIPYGDRLKYGSRGKARRSPSSDRPPLEAKYIR